MDSVWLKNNIITVGVLVVGMAIAWGALNSRVMNIEAEEKALEEKVADYPSQDFFNLKFHDIDQQLAELKSQLNTVTKQTK